MVMINAFNAPALSDALTELKNLIRLNEEKGVRTVIFCEDRLTLAAERCVCQAVGGTFLTAVYTFARFLNAETGTPANILSSQGSAMAIRKIIDDNRQNLSLFKRLSGATAAQDVYDTIALLYSSRISADDLKAVKADNPLLDKKLKDLALIYGEYSAYLKENGCVDRNAYLKTLPAVICASDRIKGSHVIFLGFQSFTCSVAECARACMETAEEVVGLFIGGAEDIYTNEALASFCHQAKSLGGCPVEGVKSALIFEAEHLRKHLFNPLSFHTASPLATDKVKLYEARNIEEELEYIAANIIKHVFDDGVRYQSISVMLPDVGAYLGTLERVFKEYSIPFYADKRYSLAEHPLCGFLLSYLNCVWDGCLPASVSEVVSSPIFAANRKDKDIFINYSLRLAAYRGGVKRQPKPEILAGMKFNFDAVERVRTRFLGGLNKLPARGTGTDFCNALREILKYFGATETVDKLAEDFKDGYPSLSALSARASEGVLNVLAEAEKLTCGVSMTAREFYKILKSGFTAAEVSLIPPKQDAVFVGDLTATANIGTEVLFAAGLTDGVPCAVQDTAIITDREIASLEALNVAISPKILQVNLRSREMAALNVCAFKRRLYLSYPVRQGNDEHTESEIISYARKLFSTPGGDSLQPLDYRKAERAEELLPYYCSRPLPAVKKMIKGSCRPEAASAIYAVLSDNGYAEKVGFAMREEGVKRHISCGEQLFGRWISPTTLETYFTCPYKNFLKQGLKLAEREEGVMRPLDSGNFIHAVLQKLAYSINNITTGDQLEDSVNRIAKELLATPQYSSLGANKRGEYTANALVNEAIEIARGAFEQLYNSNFEVSAAEQPGEVELDGGYKIYGRVDRVDSCGDMVRIIDYKTGNIDSSVVSYYMGLKLQLPLYLTAVSKGKRAVGAYYFPAHFEFKEKADGMFRLKGFMDGSEEVVKNSDFTISNKMKSEYFDAYLNGRKLDTAMSQEDFSDFLSYSVKVAQQGVGELVGGNVTPSPVEEACKYCKLSGCCGFSAGTDGEERKTLKVSCSKIVEIMRGGKEEE